MREGEEKGGEVRLHHEHNHHQMMGMGMGMVVGMIT